MKIYNWLFVLFSFSSCSDMNFEKGKIIDSNNWQEDLNNYLNIHSLKSLYEESILYKRKDIIDNEKEYINAVMYLYADDSLRKMNYKTLKWLIENKKDTLEKKILKYSYVDPILSTGNARNIINYYQFLIILEYYVFLKRNHKLPSNIDSIPEELVPKKKYVNPKYWHWLLDSV